MIHLTMTPLMSTIRVYDQPDGYENRVPYLGLVTIFHMSDKVAYVCGAVGKIDRGIHRQAMAMLRERGITTLMIERRGRMKTIELSAPAAALQQVTQ